MSSIPSFDVNGVLPPYSGKAVQLEKRSPYQSTLPDFTTRFAASPARRGMIRGLVSLRRELRKSGITSGFHWFDGSFVEDVESHQNRSPSDIDMVSFIMPPGGMGGSAWDQFVRSRPNLFNRSRTKELFSCDAYYVSLTPAQGYTLVRLTAYWFGLFSHRRDGIWKGLVQVPLESSDDDQAVVAMLDALGNTP